VAAEQGDAVILVGVAADILHATLDRAPAHNTGLSVAECAEADRVWPLQKHGE
jgi:hypothetical protein